MQQEIPGTSPEQAGQTGPQQSLAAGSGQAGDERAVGRRALLRRGGAVAGAIGAGLAAAAVATPASAATSDPVLQGTTNSVGTDQPATEITAANSSAATPTLILTNTGSTAAGAASPALRLTPAATGLNVPSASTAGGDLVATNDGNLWFTHAVPSVATFAAVVHTDGNSNSFAPLSAPQRILDTRTSAGRTHVLDPAGKFDSTGRLLAGQTIHIDLTSLVSFGDAVTANLTVTAPAAAGFLTLWSGAGSRPTASSINYAAGQTIANLTVSGIAEFPAVNPTTTDTIAIFARTTTHVILDVTGFNVADFGQVNPAFLAAVVQGATRARRARQALAQLRKG